jgi:hypothetical protein
VHQLQQWDKAARIQYCHWFRPFEREGFHMYQLRLQFEWNALIYSNTN